MPEFHDLSEIALNSDGQSWGNLGYWKEEQDYSGACAAMAQLLGDAARLDRQSIIMDAGFGCGDQLLMWLDQYHVASVRGVNNSHTQTARARQLLLEAGYGADAENLREGDISDPEQWDFGHQTQPVNRVLALDCAYHFPDRIRFWEQSVSSLEAGGVIGLTDLLLSDQHRQGTIRDLVLRVMLKASRIPAANMVCEQEYLDQMRTTGLAEIRLEDISADVLPGFGHWWRRYRSSAQGKATNLPWSSRMKYAVTARFLDWAWRRNILRYCLISAVRR